MAEIRRYPVVRHLRGEPNAHVLRYRKGRLVADGQEITAEITRRDGQQKAHPTDGDQDGHYIVGEATRTEHRLINRGVHGGAQRSGGILTDEPNRLNE